MATYQDTKSLDEFLGKSYFSMINHMERPISINAKPLGPPFGEDQIFRITYSYPKTEGGGVMIRHQQTVQTEAKRGAIEEIFKEKTGYVEEFLKGMARPIKINEKNLYMEINILPRK